MQTLCPGVEREPQPFGMSFGVSPAPQVRNRGPPTSLSCLTFGAVLACVAHFAGTAVGAIAGQAVATTPTGAGEAGITHWRRGKSSIEFWGVARPPTGLGLALGGIGCSCVGVFLVEMRVLSGSFWGVEVGEGTLQDVGSGLIKG